ncbi:MAG: alginate export family protein [Candidatus Omnitrophota bacterium]|jgi:hypothetical protein
MSKRLILILALAFVAGFAFTAYAEVQNVKVSGDITMYGVMRNLDIAYVDATPDKEQEMISITRVRIDADLTDNVAATVRFLNERYWGQQDETVDNTDIDLDLAYVTLKQFLPNMFNDHLTLALGRQELRYGNAMIIGDPDTNNVATSASALGGTSGDPDLSARKAFDAVKLVLDYDPLVVDIVAAKVEEDTKNVADDVNLYGMNANYKLSNKTLLEGYYWLKHYGRKKDAQVPKGMKTHVLGARMATQLKDNLSYNLEAAYQFGTYHNETTAARPTVDRRAWGLETALTYAMPNVKYTPSTTLGYAFFSGEKDSYSEDNRSHYRAWDPMFEDQRFGDIANALFDQSNAHILMASGSMKPADDITVTGEYYAYWWDKPYSEGASVVTRRADSVTATDSKFVAQEIDLKATYDYTEDVQFGLMTGVLIPGPAFTKESRRTATEVIGSMKVTF